MKGGEEEGMKDYSPSFESLEGLLIGEVKHEDKSHGTSIVGCGDCAITFLPSSIPNLQFDPFVLPEYRQGGKVGERRREGRKEGEKEGERKPGGERRERRKGEKERGRKGGERGKSEERREGRERRWREGGKSEGGGGGRKEEGVSYTLLLHS